MVDEITTIDIALLDEQTTTPDENMAVIIHKLTAPRATRIFRYTSLVGWILSTGAITSNMIANQAVTDDKISPAAVGTTHIEENAITEALIADGAVTNDKVGAGAITGPKLGKVFTNQASGIGNISEGVPTRDDSEVVHTPAGSYTNTPMVIITPKAALTIYLLSVVILNHICTITLGLKNPDVVDPYYDLIIISND